MAEERLDRWLGNQYDTTEGLERRHWFRAACDWPVEVGNPSLGKATVTDVSPRGLQLQMLFHPGLQRGQELVIKSAKPVHAPLQNQITTRVRWTQREGKFLWLGVAFINDKALEQSWVQALLTKVFQRGSEQKRTNLRICCHIPARIVAETGSIVVTVLDLSLGGALLESGESYQAGSRVELQLGPWAPLPELKIPGTLQRSIKPGGLFHFGMKFDRRQPGETILGYLRQAYQQARLEQ